MICNLLQGKGLILICSLIMIFIIYSISASRPKLQFRKLAEEKNGCCWELFEVYRHLKSLIYVIGCHGVPWSMKSVTKNCKVTTQNNEVVDIELFGTTSLEQMLGDLQIDELQPNYDVHPHNSKFRKSSPGDPLLLLCLIRFLGTSWKEMHPWLLTAILDLFVIRYLLEKVQHPSGKVQISRDNVAGFSCVDYFLFRRDLNVFEQRCLLSFLFAKARGGTCSVPVSILLNDILLLAYFIPDNGFGVCDLFVNNCEDFPIY